MPAIATTVNKTLTEEIAYLEKHDEFVDLISQTLDMPFTGQYQAILPRHEALIK